MSTGGPAGTVGVLGGTGALGRGLALRWALSGRSVLLGSRDPARAQATADALRATLPPAAPAPQGAANSAAAACEVAVVALPLDGLAATLEPLADTLAGKTVISCVNPLTFDAAGPHPVRVAAGSAGQEVGRLLPGARVVGGFHHVSAPALADADAVLDADVLLTGDDAEAKAAAAELVAAIPRLRPVDAGPLRLSGPVEDLTAVLIAVNRRYRVRAGVRVTGLDDAALGRSG